MKVKNETIETATDIPNCITIQEIQQATAKDDHTQQLREHIIRGWPESRIEVPK